MIAQSGAANQLCATARAGINSALPHSITYADVENAGADGELESNGDDAIANMFKRVWVKMQKLHFGPSGNGFSRIAALVS